MFAAFAPYEELAGLLLRQAGGQGGDGSHDTSHLARVWKNAALIQAAEGGDAEILVASVLLHDCVPVEKSSPLRAQASRLSARRAVQILGSLDWPGSRIDAVAHAVEAHSFSAGIAPETIESKIVQDADRLDALGMLGVARCFYVAGRMGSALYDAEDPHGLARPLDDARFALDHFRAKLLSLSASFQTATGAQLAQVRHDRVLRFLRYFAEEIELAAPRRRAS